MSRLRLDQHLVNLGLAERRAKGLTTALPAITPYKEGKVVYLTFDDGPDDTNTPAILDILKEEYEKNSKVQ